MVFSLFAIIILATFAYLLSINSIYLQVSAENQHRKPELAEGVMGAIVLYTICLVLSSFSLWQRTRVIRGPIEDTHLFED